MKLKIYGLMLLIAFMFIACGGSNDSSSSKLTLSSNSFSDSGVIEHKYSCYGDNISPHLKWSPSSDLNASSYTLVMDDETDPCGTGDEACKHWSVFNIPNNIVELQEDQNISSLSGVVESSNFMGSTGYAGPCPPSGPHTYNFTIYALKSSMPTIEENSTVYYGGITRSEFSENYKEHIITSATIKGVYTP